MNHFIVCNSAARYSVLWLARLDRRIAVEVGQVRRVDGVALGDARVLVDRDELEGRQPRELLGLLGLDQSPT